MLSNFKMTGLTQKHRNFVLEPMRDKPVTDLAGIAETLGSELIAAGFDKAYVVLGQFLVLKKNKEKFQEWLKDTCNANSDQSQKCFNCLNDWCEKFL
ncbi:PREDICTED: barrier-to-autointegration factor-like [Nicrophorus vespilloides]|uniref:Barrier-to-autointegration factor-like n=1 Tax=Nicrophorus vespilloides TaxID=110193 RepID=A0ABM1MEH9_NICVS|nr:PREDICTED: barrier-to-autointegration factor-like [Nicrophorus vespilloides]